MRDFEKYTYMANHEMAANITLASVVNHSGWTYYTMRKNITRLAITGINFSLILMHAAYQKFLMLKLVSY